jgi:hypothetical protein
MSEYLCRNLKLTIRRVNNDAQIQLFLRDDLNLREVELLCDVYDQRSEAVMIGMRRLVAKAIMDRLISDCLGESTTSSSATGASAIRPITSSTGEDS